MPLLLLALALSGCVPRPPPPVLDTSEPVVLALVWDRQGLGDPVDVPDPVARAVVKALEARHLRVERLMASDFGGEFGRRRVTAQRLKWLDGRGSAHVVLVEARAEYYNQITGLYRWTAGFKATVLRAGDSFPADTTFQVPVFLQFGQQDGVEALEAAQDVLAQRLGRLVDTALGADDGQSEVEGPATRDGPPGAGEAEEAQGPGGLDLGPVYFVLVDRFKNGDPSNDGDADPSDPQAFHGGDLRGVIQELDELQALGVRTLWLSPVFAMRDEPIGPWGAYHGYWPTGGDGIEPRFGTAGDLEELSRELHRRGMRLLLDVVLNHVAYDAPLVAQHPDWFHHRGDVVDWSDPEQATDFDVHGLPDLAQENPEVSGWLMERAEGWIHRYRPDGFRLDAVRHVPVAFWRRFNDRMRAVAGPDFVLLGELFEGDPAVLARTWRDGHFTHMFDFPLYYALTDVVCGGAAPGRLASTLAQDARYRDPSHLVTFVDNHDLPRIASRCADPRAALDLLLSLRGTPAIFQGTERGMVGAQEPENRASVPWDRPADPWLATALHRRLRLGLGRGSSRVLALDDEAVLVGSRGAAGGVLRAVGSGGAVQERPWSEARWSARPADGVVELRAAGEGLRLVGAGPTLGDWDPGAGLLGERRDGLTVFRIEATGGSILEYKLVRRGEDGAWSWEPRANRTLFVDGDLVAELTWGS